MRTDDPFRLARSSGDLAYRNTGRIAGQYCPRTGGFGQFLKDTLLEFQILWRRLYNQFNLCHNSIETVMKGEIIHARRVLTEQFEYFEHFSRRNLKNFISGIVYADFVSRCAEYLGDTMAHQSCADNGYLFLGQGTYPAV